MDNPFFSQFHPSEAKVQEIRERQLQQVEDDRKVVVFWVVLGAAILLGIIPAILSSALWS